MTETTDAPSAAPPSALPREVALGRVELLSGLPTEVRRLVVEAFEEVHFDFGAVLMREGDPADSYWLLTSGRVRVVRRGADGGEVTLTTLEPGATFGEGALLRHGQRTSTVRATTPGSALRLDASILRALASTQPSVAESLSRIRRRHQVSDLLRLASPLARLAGPSLSELVDRLEPVEVPAGAVITRRGEMVDALHLVEDGRLVVRTGTEEAGDGEARRPVQRYVRRGDLVGEAALLSGTPSSETVEAVTDTKLLRLTRDDLDAVVAAHPQLRQGLEDLKAAYEERTSAYVPLDFAEERVSPDGAGGDPATAMPAAPGTGAVAPQRRPPSAEGAAPGRRLGRRPKVVRQIDEMDCGVAALSMVCRHYGKRVPLSRLRTLVGATLDGTSAAGIVAAARTLGFDSRAIKASKSELSRLPVPFIAHWHSDHWVVVTGVSADSVSFNDPALGRRRLPVAEFLAGWSGYAIEASPGPDFQPGGSRAQGLEWMAELVRPHRSRLGAVAGLAFLLSALALSLEVVIQVVVDRIVRPGHPADVGSVLVVLVAVAVVLTLGTLGQRLVLLRTAAALDRDGLRFLSERLLSLPLSYFASRRTGDLQRRLDGLREARSLLADVGVITLTLGAQLLASVALLFYYSVPIAIGFLIVVPLYVGVARYTLARIGPATASLEEEAGRYASRQVEVVKGIETAKALAAETALQDGLVANQVALAARQVHVDRMRALYSAVTQGLGFAILAAFLAVGADEVVHHTLTIGGLVACVTLVALATYPMQELVVTTDSFQEARTLIDRAQDVFDTEPEQSKDRASLAPVPSISGQVSLRDVSFAYTDGGPPVLDRISLDIPAGATVAVVGRSGSGKTTFARLVAGLVTPTSGTVSFDGVDARGLDHRQLRSHIGMVLQETYLFSDTIEANIAFGTEIDPARVREAAQLANAAEFIERLPLGYWTRVGESGLALSGGQRQRLAIARALYRRPALLVMDEATSALDAESERAIQENLGRVLGDRTAIVIAHRLSTVRGADLIVVLDRGRLVEQGTHDELVSRRGLYFLLTAQQLDL